MPRILDRYIFRELLPPFLIGLALFTFVLVMNLLLELARIAIKGDVPLLDVATMLFWSVPHILALTIPMAVLLACNLGLGRMAADNEVTVLHASGVGLMRIGRPVFAFCVAATLLTGWVFMRLVPESNRHARAIAFEMAKKQLHRGIQAKEFYDRYGSYVIFTYDIDEDTNIWSRVFVADVTHSEEPRLTFAQHGRVHYNEIEKYVVLELEDGESFVLDLKDPGQSSRSVFEKHKVLINLENMMPTSTPTPGDREMRVLQLLEEIRRRQHAGMKWRPFAVELHKKFAVPIACVVFGVIGLAIGARNQARGMSAGFVISLAIILVYYIFITTGERLGDTGQAAPWLSMWAANIVIGGVGTFMLVLAAREIELGVWDRAATLALRAGNAAGRLLSGSPGPRRASGPRPRGEPTAAAGPRRRGGVVIRIPRVGPNFPRILDRHVLRQWARSFVMVLVAITALYVLIDLTRILDDINENDVPTQTVIDHYKYGLPNILFIVLGPTTLVATLWSFGLLNRNNEIIAMKASGISIYRIVMPVVMVAGLLSVLAYYIYDHIIPVAQRRALALREEIIRGPKRSHGMEGGRWMWGEGGASLFNYSAYDTSADLMHNVKVFELDSERFALRSVVAGQRARWVEGSGWRFEDAWTRTFAADGTSTFAHHGTLDRPYAEDPTYFVAEKKAADELSYVELGEYIRQLETAGFSVRSLKVRLAQKLALPFVPLVMTLIGTPFALRIGKRGNLFGVGVAVALVAVYWGVIAAFGPLGETGILAAVLAAWAPNILFAVAGTYLLLTLDT